MGERKPSVIVVAMNGAGRDATRWCPVHGECLCGERHALTMTALWCFQFSLHAHSLRPLHDAPPLVQRWSAAHAAEETTVIHCAGCAIYPALGALELGASRLDRLSRDETLAGRCLHEGGCLAGVTMPAFARLPSSPLDTVVPGDRRFLCDRHLALSRPPPATRRPTHGRGAGADGTLTCESS